MKYRNFNDLFINMSSNTYNKIQKNLGRLGMGEITISVFLNFILEEYFIESGVISILGIISILSSEYLMSSGKILHTKDGSEVKQMYQEFLEHYNQLNKIFDFKDPIQIYIMYIYLLENGYLSQNKNYECTSEGVEDNILFLKGANIITGVGVCRHISVLLVDILNTEGINSYNLRVYVKENQIKEDKKEKIFGNHVITYANWNEKSYFLDATLKKIYRMNEINKKMLYNDEFQVFTRKNAGARVNNYKQNKQMKLLLSEPNLSITLEEEQKLVEETLKICFENIDIFEHFYSDNSELYQEISNKFRKIKIKR